MKDIAPTNNVAARVEQPCQKPRWSLPPHSSVWSLLEALEADTVEAATAVLKRALDNLVTPTLSRASAASPPSVRSVRRVYYIAAESRSLPDLLRSIGHNICFVCE